MQEAYAIARQNMKKSARRGQENCNQRAWSSTLESGDHVLVRNLTPMTGVAPENCAATGKTWFMLSREEKALRVLCMWLNHCEELEEDVYYTGTFSFLALTWLKRWVNPT